MFSGRPSAQIKRDKNKVVSFRVPHNAAVQIYDYKDKKARVVFGPEMVMLGPDEQFTQLSLSGGKPKRPNQIKSLCLLLGPDFCTDIITVETADHARLSLQLSYNWSVLFYHSSCFICQCIFCIGILKLTRPILMMLPRSFLFQILLVMLAKLSPHVFVVLLLVSNLTTSIR